MEIGSGKGGFLIEYARKHPELNIIGSEWDTTWAVYAGERMLKHQIDNAQMLRGDVYFFLRDRIPDNSIDAFHMYFPDPWPKKRQHKNRLLRPEFLVQVARTLKAGKRLFYWGTDHEEYNEWALEIFSQTPNVRFLVKNEAEPTEGIMTNFEKKYRKEGRPIYRSVLEFSK
jgi:tRNA (guanine-N7-)-methyltransferase